MVKLLWRFFIDCREKVMINLPQQPSPEAVEMLAKRDGLVVVAPGLANGI